MSKILFALIALTIGNAQGAEALRLSQKQACRGLPGLTDYIGTDCDPKACQAVTEPAGSHVKPQYPGPLCVCKPCPEESSSQFDKVLYNCLVNGLQYCPASAVSIKADGSSNTTQQPPSSSSPSASRDEALEKSKEKVDKDDAKEVDDGDKPTRSQEQATVGTAEDAVPKSLQAQNFIGLAIALGVSIGGFAFLGIWLFLDCKRNNRKQTGEPDAQQEPLTTPAPQGAHVTSSPENAPVGHLGRNILI